MRVKPVPGRLVRDPVTKRELPADGAEVSPTDPFWARRLRSGDVELDTARPDPEQGPPKE